MRIFTTIIASTIELLPEHHVPHSSIQKIHKRGSSFFKWLKKKQISTYTPKIFFYDTFKYKQRCIHHVRFSSFSTKMGLHSTNDSFIAILKSGFLTTAGFNAQSNVQNSSAMILLLIFHTFMNYTQIRLRCLKHQNLSVCVHVL